MGSPTPIAIALNVVHVIGGLHRRKWLQTLAIGVYITSG